MADLISEQQLAQLIHELKQLPPRKGYSPTFLQMARFPDRENVWSNILEFYFQSTNGHGLNNAVFQAFMAALGETIDPEITVTASREQTTSLGRIDLVLETPDMVVGIENKVWQQLDNPLDDYRAYLDQIAGGRRVFGCVLSLNDIRLAERQRFPDWHFVTYRDFCATLRQRIFNPPQISNKYVLFLDDFINSIVKPNQGDVMDSQRLEFFAQHQADMEALLKEVTTLKEDMRRKVKSLWAAISAAPPNSKVRIEGGLVPNNNGPFEVLWIRMNVAPGLVLVLDAVLFPAGWKIFFHNERADQTIAEKWLKEHGIHYSTQQDPWRAVVDYPALSYDADIAQVHEWVMKNLQPLLPQ